MVRKFTMVGFFCALFLALTAAAASAGGHIQANGQGQTPLSASLGLNAKDDLSGQLNYNADPNGSDSGFSAHCAGYGRFGLLSSFDGFPKVKVSATCTDKDGNTVYLRAAFIDRGEPGTYDFVCIRWSHSPGGAAFIHDKGYISNGNIQIHV